MLGASSISLSVRHHHAWILDALPTRRVHDMGSMTEWIWRASAEERLVSQWEVLLLHRFDDSALTA